MLESDWLTNILRRAIIFRETHGERSSRQAALDRITCKYHFTKLFQKVLQQQNNQNPQRHWPNK